MKTVILAGTAVITILLAGCSTAGFTSGSAGTASNADSSGAGHYGSYGRVSESPGPGNSGTSK
jgi:outer membrane lipoprotein SlyB